MKPFLVFSGANYYPQGGWKDFVGDYYTLDDAKAAALAAIKSLSGVDEPWAHIVGIDNGERKIILVWRAEQRIPSGWSKPEKT